MSRIVYHTTLWAVTAASKNIADR